MVARAPFQCFGRGFCAATYLAEGGVVSASCLPVFASPPASFALSDIGGWLLPSMRITIHTFPSSSNPLPSCCTYLNGP